MPLTKSASKAARNENIRREIDAGKPLKQAVAIGYSVQREAKKHHAAKPSFKLAEIGRKK